MKALAVPEPVNRDLPAPEHEEAISIFALLHRLFRGRYLVAVPAITFVAIVGAIAGFLAGGPEYTSIGVIRVLPSLPKILYTTELTETPQSVRFQQYVETQAALMTTERVMQTAIEDRDLSDQVREIGIMGLRRLLSVRTERDAPELIYVSATSSHAVQSRQIVAATIEAYMSLYGGKSALAQPELINTLEQLKRDRDAKIRLTENRIKTTAADWGTEDLNSLRDAAIRRVDDLRERLREEDSSLIGLQAALSQWQTLEASADDLESRDIHEIIQIFPSSPRMADLAKQRTLYEVSLRDLESSGIRREHRSYRETERSLAEVDRKIREHAFARLSSATDSQAVSEQIAVSESRHAALEEEIKKLQEDAARLGIAITEIDRLNAELADLRKEWQMASDRLEAVVTESKVEDFSEVGGRISVISPASTPTEPSGDSRRKYAAFGFVGGGGMTFLAFAGLGFLDRRLRYSDDITTGQLSAPLLAVLPSWDNQEELVPFAVANTVHRIRTQLQLQFGHEHGRPIVVTSGYPGEGKTSVVISLALSYAHSGSRVLLVDFDPIGRALTRHIGQGTPARLAKAVYDPNPASLVSTTRIRGVDLLAAHPDDEMIGGRLSTPDFQRLFDRLSPGYDAVIVDTGPLLGGIEVSMACAAADGVVLVVGRGTSHRIYRQCTEQLRSVGARLVGVVFNRATQADFTHSPSSHSQSARSQRPDSGSVPRDWGHRQAGDLAGVPLAEVVASTMIINESDGPSEG